MWPLLWWVMGCVVRKSSGRDEPPEKIIQGSLIDSTNALPPSAACTGTMTLTFQPRLQDFVSSNIDTKNSEYLESMIKQANLYTCKLLLITNVHIIL